MSGRAVEEEEDIDKEFEKESEPEPAPTLPKSSLPVAPKPETPVAVVDVPEIPETETRRSGTVGISPALDTPLPVSVTNWDQMVARSDVQEPKTRTLPTSRQSMCRSSKCPPRRSWSQGMNLRHRQCPNCRRARYRGVRSPDPGHGDQLADTLKPVPAVR